MATSKPLFSSPFLRLLSKLYFVVCCVQDIRNIRRRPLFRSQNYDQSPAQQSDVGADAL